MDLNDCRCNRVTQNKKLPNQSDSQVLQVRVIEEEDRNEEDRKGRVKLV